MNLSLSNPTRVGSLGHISIDNGNAFGEMVGTTSTLSHRKTTCGILSIIANGGTHSTRGVCGFLGGRNFECLRFVPYLRPFSSRHNRDTCDLSPGSCTRFLMGVFGL